MHERPETGAARTRARTLEAHDVRLVISNRRLCDAVERQAAFWTRAPTLAERTARKACIVVESADAAGSVVASRLSTPEAYTLTAQTTAHIAERVLAGDLEVGFQTPSRLFGADFILRFDGVSRLDLEPKR